MNVVIVEDEGITALFLKEVVEDKFHNVVGVFDESATVLQYFNNDKKVDLILMDIKIKGTLGGVELANKLHIKYPDLSIVFITSFKDSETIKSAKVVSPIGYLIKPVIDKEIEAMLMVVESSISNRKKDDVYDPNIVRCGKYVYNKSEKLLLLNSQIVYLSNNERECIDLLIKKRDSYVTYEEIINNIWNGENNREVSLRELMYRLRKKLPDLNLNNTPKIGYNLICSNNNN